MKNILIVDDDLHIGNMLEEVLTKDGYKVTRAYSGTEALLILSNNTPDLILLDLMLPGLSGEDLLPKIQNIPVIVVSAKVDVEDKVNLLLSGAADYVTKPFNTKELLARIKVALRNQPAKNDSKISHLGITLDLSSHEVFAGDRRIKPTRTEYAILKLLFLNPSRVTTKSAILDNIGNDTPDCTESSLKIHISNLRKKLRDATGNDCIESVWGIGFKLKDE